MYHKHSSMYQKDHIHVPKRPHPCNKQNFHVPKGPHRCIKKTHAPPKTFLVLKRPLHVVIRPMHRIKNFHLQGRHHPCTAETPHVNRQQIDRCSHIHPNDVLKNKGPQKTIHAKPMYKTRVPKRPIVPPTTTCPEKKPMYKKTCSKKQPTPKYDRVPHIVMIVRDCRPHIRGARVDKAHR